MWSVGHRWTGTSCLVIAVVGSLWSSHAAPWRPELAGAGVSPAAASGAAQASAPGEAAGFPSAQRKPERSGAAPPVAVLARERSLERVSMPLRSAGLASGVAPALATGAVAARVSNRAARTPQSVAEAVGLLSELFDPPQRRRPSSPERRTDR